MNLRNSKVGDFRKKVSEIKESLKEREILTSGGCRAYLQNLAEAVTNKFGVDLSVILLWNTPDDFVARATGRNELFFNCNNSFVVNAKTLPEKVVLLKALVLHECGHLLFTDFKLAESRAKVWEKNRKLFPEPTNPEYKDFLVDAVAMDPVEAHQWYMIYHSLDNSIEDGFIEYEVLKHVPGEGKCLLRLRNIQMDEFQSVKQMRNAGAPIQAILFDMILQLAKYNTVKMDADDKADPAVKALLDNYNLVQAAVHAQKSYDRAKLVNELFSKLYYFFKQEENKEQPQEGQGQQKEQSEGQGADSSAQNSPSDADDGNQQSDGDNNSQDQPQGESNGSQNDSGDQSDTQNSSDAGGQQSGGNQVGSESKNSGNSGSKRPSPNAIRPRNDSIKDEVNTGSGSVLNDHFLDDSQDSADQAGTSAEKLEQMSEQADKQQRADEDKPADEALKAEQFKEDVAQEKAKEEQEKELAKDLASEAQNMDLGEFNKNVKLGFERKVDVTNRDKEKHEEDMKEIGGLIKRTVKEIRDKIKDKQQGGKINGLYQGRYLDAHSLYRFDQRVLCTNDLPEDIPNMAIALLIDSSDSMSSSNKQDYARQTALLLYHFGRELNVPVMVCAHNAQTYGECDIKSLADYGSVDGNDKYRICQFRPSGGNRDGAALRYVAEKVSQRQEETKIVFVISDGLPSAYYGNEGEKDIKSVLMDYHKKDVKFIACGLGSDAARIKELYQQGLTPAMAAEFLDCSDPKQLPISIVRCIKNLIK